MKETYVDNSGNTVMGFIIGMLIAVAIGVGVYFFFFHDTADRGQQLIPVSERDTTIDIEVPQRAPDVNITVPQPPPRPNATTTLEDPVSENHPPDLQQHPTE